MTEYEDTAPEVTWAMPADAPSHVDVAKRNEYVEDGLKKCGEIIFACWEAWRSTTWAGEYDGGWLDQRERIVAEEAEACRKTLANDGPLDRSVHETLRWRAIQIVNLNRVLASSSAMRERGSRDD